MSVRSTFLLALVTATSLVALAAPAEAGLPSPPSPNLAGLLDSSHLPNPRIQPHSGVTCRAVAPASHECQGPISGTGTLHLDLSQLVAKGPVSFVLRQDSGAPTWECTASAADATACDGTMQIDGAYTLVASIDAAAEGLWGWAWNT